ncbi:MAG: hypothetical protein ABEH35_08890 [Haloarculaceae archaeon]
MAEPLVGLLADAAARVVRIGLLLSVGVFLANLAVAFGLVEKIAALSAYLTDPANLPEEVGTAILATTVSPTAGYGMLAEFRESGVLDDRATLVAVTINTFFGFAQHIFTFYAPVLIPILGLRVGLLYVGARAAISLAITLVGIVGGAVFLSDGNVARSSIPDVDTPDDADDATRRERVREALADTREKLRSILPRLAVVYTLVVVLVGRYDLTRVTGVAEPLTDPLGLPGAATVVVAVFAIDTTNGALVIAPLIENGTFTARGAVATMLIGGIVSFAVTTFKRSIPFQYGIWGAEFGSKVIVVNTTLKVVFIAAAVAVLLV